MKYCYVKNGIKIGDINTELNRAFNFASFPSLGPVREQGAGDRGQGPRGQKRALN